MNGCKQEMISFILVREFKVFIAIPISHKSYFISQASEHGEIVISKPSTVRIHHFAFSSRIDLFS